MMNTIKSLLTLTIIFALFTPVLAPDAVYCATNLRDDVVLRAMQDEMSRTLQHLKLPEAPPPYFLAYRITDRYSVEISARYGALTSSNQQSARDLYIDLRVGDPALDNTNFAADWSAFYPQSVRLTVEDNYSVLRKHLWLATDRAYKRAVEDLSRKIAYIQSHPQRNLSPNLAPVEPVVQIATPAVQTFDVPSSTENVRTASALLQQFPRIQEWEVTLRGNGITRRFLSSEGSVIVRSDAVQMLEITATALADDGERLTSFRHFFARNTDQLPAGDQLQREVTRFATELSNAVAAPAIENYSGPVLFDEFAAAQLISFLFAAQIVPAQPPILLEDWMQQSVKSGKFIERLGRRVFPDFINITDEPARRNYSGRQLLGYRPFDEEGVPGEELTLVKDGRLLTLPTDRQTSVKIPRSNGHSVGLTSGRTAPGITNLFVKSSKTKPHARLLADMRSLCRDTGNEFGLVVTLLEDPRIADNYRWTESGSETPELLPPPVLIFRLDAKTGNLTPLRGLTFDEISVRTLRDILVTGKDERVWDLMQPSYLSNQFYPATIVTPAILVEELDLKAKKQREPLPVTPAPLSVHH